MKLSEKGYEKLFEFFMSGKYFDATKCDQIEFEPDDFESGCCQNGKGHVLLTVEEAKEAIADYIDVVAEVVRQRNKPEIKIKHPKSILLLMDRIEQAESQND